MADQANARLVEALRGIANRARKYREQYRERGLGEENTKASLIDPLLEALGWDIRDPDEVYREFRPEPRDKPVDYCLRLLRNTRLLIEAKGLGEDLSDRRWIAQVLGYATMAGAEWCVLTDGDEYRLYNATAALPADSKLFCQVKLAEAPEGEAAKVLALISRSNMEGEILTDLWKAHHIDRRVREAIRGMLDTADRKVVKLIRQTLPDLAPKDIAESIRRLDIRIEIPSALPDLKVRAKRGPAAVRPGKGKRSKQGRTEYGVTLAEVIAAGLLRPPLPLFRKYRGRRMEASLSPDGRVDFQGTSYESCSQAASAARATVTGRPMHTNAWTFWLYRDDAGKPLCLDAARQRLLKAKGKGG
jgi:hypothetical protein